LTALNIFANILRISVKCAIVHVGKYSHTITVQFSVWSEHSDIYLGMESTKFIISIYFRLFSLMCISLTSPCWLYHNDRS